MNVQLKSVGIMLLLLLSIEALPAVAQTGASDSIPRLSNGKPSMGGFWGQVRRRDVTSPAIAGNVAELPFSEWGLEQWETYDRTDPEQGDYAGSCMPFGISRTVFGPQPLAIVQDDDHLVFLAEQNSWFHMVPTDGRPHDPELPPSWWGDSVGHWDGDMLVIETRNLNGYTKVDTAGHPMSSLATITQTFTRVDADTIDHTYTLDDPGAYTETWTVSNTWTQYPEGFRIMEYSCMENNLTGLTGGTLIPWKRPIVTSPPE
jgi:hypothetical protein